MKNKKVIIIVIVFILLLIGIICYFFLFSIIGKKNNTDNVINEDIFQKVYSYIDNYSQEKKDGVYTSTLFADGEFFADSPNSIMIRDVVDDIPENYEFWATKNDAGEIFLKLHVKKNEQLDRDYYCINKKDKMNCDISKVQFDLYAHYRDTYGCYSFGDNIVLKDGSEWYSLFDVGTNRYIYLLSKNIVDYKEFDIDGVTKVYNEEKEGNIGYYLNHEYIQKVSHLGVKHVTLLSYRDIYCYIMEDCLSYNDFLSSDSYYWIKDATENQVNYDLFVIKGQGEHGNTYTTTPDQKLGVRPVIVVNKNQIDLKKTVQYTT